MSFQGYFNTIEAKTGKDADGLRKWADGNGFSVPGRIKADVKAGQIVAAAKAELDLGHGHAMARVALLNGKKGD